MTELERLIAIDKIICNQKRMSLSEHRILDEVGERIKILRQAKRVYDNAPTDNSYINEHYKLFVYLLQCMGFTNAKELKDSEKLEPRMTAYEYMNEVLDSTRIFMFQDLKQDKIVTEDALKHLQIAKEEVESFPQLIEAFCYAYRMQQAIRTCIDVWTAYRQTVFNLDPVKEQMVEALKAYESEEE
jgi:hypothetical protein